MTMSQIPLLEKLDSKKPEDWKRWIECFERYCVAASQDEKKDKVQINTLVYAMGRNAKTSSNASILAKEIPSMQW